MQQFFCALLCSCVTPDMFTKLLKLATVRHFHSLRNTQTHKNSLSFSFFLSPSFFLCLSLSQTRIQNHPKFSTHRCLQSQLNPLPQTFFSHTSLPHISAAPSPVLSIYPCAPQPPTPPAASSCALSTSPSLLSVLSPPPSFTPLHFLVLARTHAHTHIHKHIYMYTLPPPSPHT